MQTQEISRGYAFKSGFPHRGTDPQAVGVELERLQQTHGVLTTEAVVEAAQADESPLHPLFEWDDTRAARSFRLDQASAILRAVIVLRQDKPSVRRFVHVEPLYRGGSEPASAGYVSLDEALAQPQYREQLLREAYCELKVFKEKYRVLSELAGLISAIDAVVPEDEDT